MACKREVDALGILGGCVRVHFVSIKCSFTDKEEQLSIGII